MKLNKPNEYKIFREAYMHKSNVPLADPKLRIPQYIQSYGTENENYAKSARLLQKYPER